jgi:hypothetical protein
VIGEICDVKKGIVYCPKRIERITTMTADPYVLDDSFDENNASFLKRKPFEIISPPQDRELEPSDVPLTISALDDLKKTKEEEIEDKAREKKRSELDDTEFIRKEIVEVKKQLKNHISDKDVSPRLLKAMATLFQEHALLGKTPGIRSEKDPAMLLIPIIENDGIKESVIMKSPIVGSLERHQIHVGSDLFEILKEYHTLYHS